MSQGALVEAIQELLEEVNLRELDLIYRFIANMVSK